MKHTFLFVVASVASSFSLACLAQTPAPVPQNLLACSKVQDAVERVRCYDAQIAAMSSGTANKPSAPSTAAPAPTPAAASAAAPASATPVVPPAPVAPAAPAAASTAAPTGAVASTPSAPQSIEAARTAKFGQEELPQSAQPPRNKEDESLSSRISALNAVGSNKYLISLENGQVWRQKESDHIASFFHVGDDVRIERGMLGSYRLWSVSTGEKNWIAVLRAR